ncbi:MAG: ComF family protein [Bacteroidales bacterium]|jgi:ComF family protein|nr:ComF family protein [Bacteroidales bacterium]
MSSAVSDILEGFAGLFWPNVCACCSTGLTRGEEYICSHCMYELPVTNFHKDRDNPIAQVFWGRAPIEYATAGYFFRKGNRIQKLVHQVKYKGQKEMGAVLGREMGKSLRGSSFSEVDLIAPVPLHPQKFRKRGYNQSEWIAKGLAEALDKPVNTQALVRRFFTATQTRKKRFARWENVDSGFGLINPGTFAGQHILLIDDVITTGATLEACIHAVLSAPGSKVSVAALALASA